MYGPLNLIASKIASILGYTPARSAFDVTSLSANNTYQGETITGILGGGAIGQWQPVISDGTPKWQVADAADSEFFPAVGILVAATTNGGAATVLRRGLIRHDSWIWPTFGRNAGAIYLDEGGDLTQTAPTNSGYGVQLIGWAVSAHVIFVDVSDTFIELA